MCVFYFIGDYGEEHGKERAAKEIELVSNEVRNLCLILGKNNIFGYKIGGDEFCLIIYENINDKYRINAKNIILTLLDNIRSNCNVTVSIGFTNYLSDNEETFDEWYKRANKYLKESKDNGKDRACWGQNIKLLIKKAMTVDIDDSNVSAIVDDNKEDDLITFKTLQAITVRFIYFFLILFFCLFLQLFAYCYSKNLFFLHVQG